MQAPPSKHQPVNLINEAQALQQCLQTLEQSDTLSVDLEFDNNSYGYGVTLCVVQVATINECFVIDSLAGLDLQPLFSIFESEAVQKIVHSPGEDLRLLHSLGCYPKNVFDTELAARLLNYELTSLSVLLREKLNVTLDKKQQRSNWLKRPLSPAQVAYAAEDVIWLHALKALLEKETSERGLLAYLHEEQELLSTTIYTPVEKTSFLKPADFHTLSPREQYLANELLRYRDGLARRMNRPAYQVMSEEVVRELATGTLSPQSILQGGGVHPRLKNDQFAAELQRQLEQAAKAASSQNLSANKQRPPRPAPRPYDPTRNAAADREEIFAPIQQALIERFGQHAGKFMLSNKMVNALLNGSATLDDIKPVYRQGLIREIAAAARIRIDAYERRQERK